MDKFLLRFLFKIFPCEFLDRKIFINNENNLIMAKKAFLAFFVFLALAIFTLYHSTSSMLKPSDLTIMDSAYNIAIKGKIEMIKIENGLSYFYISDDLNRVKAVYKGEVSSGEIIARGDWDGKIFYVKEILSKCHTEYGG